MYEIQAKNATHPTPEIVRLAIMAPLFQVYVARPASCKANTKRVDAIRRRAAPRKSTFLNSAKDTCDRPLLRFLSAGKIRIQPMTPTTVHGELKRYIHLQDAFCVMTP